MQVKKVDLRTLRPIASKTVTIQLECCYCGKEIKHTVGERSVTTFKCCKCGADFTVILRNNTKEERQ